MENLIANMYVGEENVFVDFEMAEPDTPKLVLHLPATRFSNGRKVADQTSKDLERILGGICKFHLEKTEMYLPPGQITVRERFDPRTNMMVYDAYYSF